MIEISNTTGLNLSSIEKDYYICLILKEISNLQYNENIPVYFKGGTSLYKRFEIPTRFSEDIDLTLDTNNLSRSKSKSLLNKVTKEYKSIDRTSNENLKKEEFTYKSAVQSIYDYDQIYSGLSNNIKVEATSFTISEPIEEIVISPIVDKSMKFKIKSISLERIFTDKIASVQNNLIRGNIREVSKHIFDIYFLLSNSKRIYKLIKTDEFYNILKFTFKEEDLRIESKLNKNNLIKICKDNYNYNEGSKSLIPYGLNLIEKDIELYSEVYNYIIDTINRNNKNNKSEILEWK